MSLFPFVSPAPASYLAHRWNFESYEAAVTHVSMIIIVLGANYVPGAELIISHILPHLIFTTTLWANIVNL